MNGNVTYTSQSVLNMPTSQTHPVLLIVSSGVKAVIFNEVLAEVDLVVEGCGRAVVFMSLVQISLSIYVTTLRNSGKRLL